MSVCIELVLHASNMLLTQYLRTESDAFPYHFVVKTGHMPGFFWVTVLVGITPPYLLLIKVHA
jgi:Ni/Fe-hydrogenase subunit HybB-like protein